MLTYFQSQNYHAVIITNYAKTCMTFLINRGVRLSLSNSCYWTAIYTLLIPLKVQLKLNMHNSNLIEIICTNAISLKLRVILERGKGL